MRKHSIYVGFCLGLILGGLVVFAVCRAKRYARENQLHTITSMLATSEANAQFAITVSRWLSKGGLSADMNIAPQDDPHAVLSYAVNECLKASNTLNHPAYDRLVREYPPYEPGSFDPRDRATQCLRVISPSVLPHLDKKPTAIGEGMWSDIMAWKNAGIASSDGKAK